MKAVVDQVGAHMLEFLDDMKRSVLERPDGALTLGRRQSLWSEITREYPDESHFRQASLGYVVCNHTIATWESLSIEPTDHRLYHRFRDLCREVLLGELSHDAAWKRFVDLDCHAGCVEFSENCNGSFALQAVRAACAGALQPAVVPTPINLELTDADIDPDTLDSHFLTSCVIACGPTWENSSDSNLRRRFWIDWLEKLYPLAYSDQSELLKQVKV